MNKTEKKGIGETGERKTGISEIREGKGKGDKKENIILTTTS